MTDVVIKKKNGPKRKEATMETKQETSTETTNQPVNDNRKYEKSPMVIGQKVNISERCWTILSSIYKLPEGAVLKVADILTGPNGRSLFEVQGENTAGASISFVVSPKMVRRIKSLSAPPAHLLAERLAKEFHRPRHEFSGLAALSAAKQIRRVVNAQGNS